MDAQEHYREAERLVAIPPGGTRAKERDVAVAQVHATLALTAVTARLGGNSIDSDLHVVDSR